MFDLYISMECSNKPVKIIPNYLVAIFINHKTPNPGIFQAAPNNGAG